MRILDNGSVTGEAVKSVHQLSRNKHKYHFCTAVHFPVSDVWKPEESKMGIHLPRPTVESKHTFLTLQHRCSPDLPEPAASRCSSIGSPAASSLSPTQSCSATETSEVNTSVSRFALSHLNTIYLRVHLTGEPVDDSVPVLLLARHLRQKLL